jgi:hypothetical protein
VNTNLPLRDFATLQRDLEDTVTDLKKNLSQENRTALLRRLKQLLEEADRITKVNAK